MKNFWTVVWRFIKYFILIYFGSSLFFVILYRFVNPPVTPIMVLRCVEQLSDGKKIKMSKQWVPIERISRDLQIGAVVAEDYKFLQHHGFDFEAINKAKEFNARSNGDRLKGGSTISQQTAKNVFLWPSRSWLRKGLETYFTVLIEFFWPKKRIMEVYLNVIEMGDGIYGAEAASQTYFKKPAARLTRSEAALLVSIFPSPRNMDPSHPSGYMLERQEIISKYIRIFGKFDY
jgi:monofunctional glycosyltransferase